MPRIGNTRGNGNGREVEGMSWERSKGWKGQYKVNALIHGMTPGAIRILSPYPRPHFLERIFFSTAEIRIP